MLKWLLSKTIGTKNERDIRKLKPLVRKINEIEEQYQKLNDDAIKAKTLEFKKRLSNGEMLDDLLPEAFAAVKNVCRRLMGKKWDVCEHTIEWDMIPFDVQLIGGIVLHQGKIAEMATGEGKTLVATMPLYLNALTGKNVQLVTVNDFLARRDSQWMGEVYKFLGLTVGCLQNQMPREEKIQAYQADITYGTNSEFGFDYLRDNGMAMSSDEQVQRGRFFAIVDEVDSILIDEARTPLIITSPVSVSTNKFAKLKPDVERLFQKQTMLTNRLMSEAKNSFDDPELQEEAGIKMYQVSVGAPKNKQLMKILEEPAARKLLEKTSLMLLSDARKEQRESIREDLFFIIDEKSHEVSLTDKGRDILSPGDPDRFVLPDMITLYQEIDEDKSVPLDIKERKKKKLDEEFAQKSETLQNLNQLLRGYSLFERDVEYVVQDNKVLIVDEFTGRLMPGRRYSDGLHQALEAKENVTIEKETQTFATITIQNYFRLYEKLSGMTGTAETESAEFKQIYKLDVICIPTHRPVRRIDSNDAIYRTKREKYAAILEEVAAAYAQGRPVLMGTISVDVSEVLSRYLKRRGIRHQVLNAKYHQQEAEIITRAGQRGAVTIATNMAGRGTDIKLGEGVVKYKGDIKDKTKEELLEDAEGGLYVIGSERHEARRIDRQLRGRCARQGDPGASKFYVSLEDDLMRLFGSERIGNIMTRIGIKEGEELSHPLLNKSIESAQKRVEQRNFTVRKHTLEYDDVMNKQREVIYNYRSRMLHDENPCDLYFEFVSEIIEDRIYDAIPDKSTAEDSDIKGLQYWFNTTFPARMDGVKATTESIDREELLESLMNKVRESFSIKEKMETPERMKELLRYVMVSSIDEMWKEHLNHMDDLRESIGLRAYGQKDPLIEYKKEGFEIFADMVEEIKRNIVANLFRTTVTPADILRAAKAHEEDFRYFDANTEIPEGATTTGDAPQTEGSFRPRKPVSIAPIIRTEKKVGRNEPCPCGSGKKYKKCCGIGEQ
jgi:preprotein translocase subunit SecA